MIVRAFEWTAYIVAVLLLALALAGLVFHQRPFAELAGVIDGNSLMVATLLFLAGTASGAILMAVKARTLERGKR